MHRRLGYKLGGGGLQDIKAHPWFAGVDWDGIYRKEVAPPFEPDVSPPQEKGGLCTDCFP
jgi:serine/threonine kinase 32